MKVLPIRKSNRLKDFDYSTDGAYFITIGTQNGEHLLGKLVGDDAHIVPPSIMLSDFGLVAQKYINNINVLYEHVSVDKYIIMPNHIHMIVVIKRNLENGTMWASSPTNAGVPKTIRSLKVLVSKEIGFSLWQRSYHEHIIRSEDDYNRIWQYIDDNPAHWAVDEYYTGQQ